MQGFWEEWELEVHMEVTEVAGGSVGRPGTRQTRKNHVCTLTEVSLFWGISFRFKIMSD